VNAAAFRAVVDEVYGAGVEDALLGDPVVGPAGDGAGDGAGIEGAVLGDPVLVPAGDGVGDGAGVQGAVLGDPVVFHAGDGAGDGAGDDAGIEDAVLGDPVVDPAGDDAGDGAGDGAGVQCGILGDPVVVPAGDGADNVAGVEGSVLGEDVLIPVGDGESVEGADVGYPIYLQSSRDDADSVSDSEYVRLSPYLREIREDEALKLTKLDNSSNERFAIEMERDRLHEAEIAALKTAVPALITDADIDKITLETQELERRTLQLEDLYATFQSALKDGTYQAYLDSRPASVRTFYFNCVL